MSSLESCFFIMAHMRAKWFRATFWLRRETTQSSDLGTSFHACGPPTPWEEVLRFQIVNGRPQGLARSKLHGTLGRTPKYLREAQRLGTRAVGSLENLMTQREGVKYDKYDTGVRCHCCCSLSWCDRSPGNYFGSSVCRFSVR